MSDAALIGGLYPKPKHENAPDFVIGKLSINVPQLREWMAAHIKANPGEDWINIDMKVSKAGKGYAVLDDWKPNAQNGQASAPAADDSFTSDDIPF